MNKQTIGTAKLQYDEDGNLEIGTFWPKINITKEQIKGSGVNNCTSKTFEEVKDCAELLLAGFFAKVSDIELRDVEKTQLLTEVNKAEKYDNGKLKEIEFEFIFIQ